MYLHTYTNMYLHTYIHIYREQNRMCDAASLCVCVRARAVCVCVYTGKREKGVTQQVSKLMKRSALIEGSGVML
jgi:hypothetical protein